MLRHEIPITLRDKVRWAIAVEATDEIIKQLYEEVEFEEFISYGDSPLP
jgi:hypothetical protein